MRPAASIVGGSDDATCPSPELQTKLAKKPSSSADGSEAGAGSGMRAVASLSRSTSSVRKNLSADTFAFLHEGPQTSQGPHLGHPYRAGLHAQSGRGLLRGELPEHPELEELPFLGVQPGKGASDDVPVLLGDEPPGRIRIDHLLRRLDPDKTAIPALGFGHHVPADPEQPRSDPVVVVPIIGDAGHGPHHRLAHGVTTGVRATQPALGKSEHPEKGKPVDTRPRGLVPSSGSLDQKRRIGCVVQVTSGLVSKSPCVTYRFDLGDTSG